MNRYRWPLPYDPTAPFTLLPKRFPAYATPTAPLMFGQPTPAPFPPGFTAPTIEELAGQTPGFTAPTTEELAGQTPAPSAPTDIAYPPTGFQAPTTAPELEGGLEAGQFERRLEQMRAEAKELQEIERETERLTKHTKLLKAQNAMAKAQQDKAKIAPREEAVQAGVKRLKEKARYPTGREALSWRTRDWVTGEPASRGLQDYIISGGTIPELEETRKQAAIEDVMSRRPPLFIARPTAPMGEEIAGLKAAAEARRAPHLAKVADIRQRRAELRRMRTPPTAREVMEHEERIARIGAPRPKVTAPEDPRLTGYRVGAIDNEILEAQDERDYLMAELELASKTGVWKSKAEAARIKELQTRLDAIQAKIARKQKERRRQAGIGAGEAKADINAVFSRILDRIEAEGNTELLNAINEAIARGFTWEQILQFDEIKPYLR